MKTLSVVCVMGIGMATAQAADLPKEGKFTGTYSAIGTYKHITIGSDRALNTFEETGLQRTDGFGDRLTFRCWGTGEVANGESSSAGYCVGTDPSSDLLEVKFAWDKHPPSEIPKGTATFIAGTGRFAGITGSVALIQHASEFKPPMDGTYVAYVSLQGNYKLP